MMDSMFSNTAIPVLEQCVNFAQTRHAILASNVANIDVPGYRARDLSPESFQARLRDAIHQRDDTWSMDPNVQSTAPAGDPLADVASREKGIVYHDQSNVGLEQQVAEITKNQLQHNLAIVIMTNHFHQLQAAISERV